MKTVSVVLVFIISSTTFTDEYVNDWARTHEPNAASQESEREEVLGKRLVRAGARTTYQPFIDTTHTRTSISLGKHFFKWRPFFTTGICLGDKGKTVTPLQAGQQFYYQHGTWLRAYVDAFLFRRTSSTRVFDTALFLNEGGVVENQDAFDFEHIKGMSSFDARHNSAFLEVRTDILDAGFGRKRLRWGNGFNGGLIISGNAPSMNLFYELHKKVKDIMSFTAFFGTPEYNRSFFPDNMPDTNIMQKGERYVAGHRAEIVIGKRVRIALNEVVNLNNQQGFNHYFNPLQVYYIASSSSAINSSNLLASGEIWVKISDGLAFYGEILNDDITPFDRGNPTRLAYQFGATWFGLGNQSDIDLRSEYTYIRAYTYTHYEYSKNWHIWMNESAGYWLGPDSDHWYVSAEKKLKHSGSIRLTGNMIRRGEKGLLRHYDFLRDGSGENAPYIQGIHENIIGFDLSGRFALYQHVDCFSMVGWQHSNNAGHLIGQSKSFPYFQLLIRAHY